MSASYTLVFVIILVDFFILLTVKVIQYSITHSNSSSPDVPLSKIWVTILNVLFTFIVSFFNLIIGRLVKTLVIFQKNRTTTEQLLEMVSFSMFTQFVNTILIVLMINRILAENSWNLLGISGTSGNVFFSMVIHIFTGMLSILIEINYFMKIFKQWRMKKSTKIITKTSV